MAGFPAALRPEHTAFPEGEGWPVLLPWPPCCLQPFVQNDEGEIKAVQRRPQTHTFEGNMHQRQGRLGTQLQHTLLNYGPEFQLDVGPHFPYLHEQPEMPAPSWYLPPSI